MESHGKGDNFEQHAEGSGHATWNSSMSSFMLTHLASLVANGTRTSSGFKKVHYNMCARAVNDNFKTRYTAENVKNHLRTWQRKFAKINRLRNLSAAGWDEDKCIITLDAEHYASYIADHKSDSEYFNKPLEHYGLMATIFGNCMATGKFAKGSSEALGTEDVETEQTDEGDGSAVPATADEHGATSSATKPNKRAKIADNEEDGLIGAFKATGQMLATAIVKAATVDMDLPEDLFDTLNSLPGFNATHISFYYQHLVANPHIGRAFYKLPFEHKMNWVAMFISDKFPGN